MVASNDIHKPHNTQQITQGTGGAGGSGGAAIRKSNSNTIFHIISNSGTITGDTDRTGVS